MRNRIQFLIFGTMILLGNISCLGQISKTPKGVDPMPLYILQLPDNLDVSIVILNDSNFVKKYNCQIKGLYENWISIPATNDTIKGIFRDIEIWQFEKNSDALKKYLSYKNTFLDDTSAKLYKEEKQEKNRYFIIYKGIRLNYNHGISIGIYNDPELRLGFLLNKYFISISYTDFRTDKKKKACYVCDINNDILLVSKILNDIVTSTESVVKE